MVKSAWDAISPNLISKLLRNAVEITTGQGIVFLPGSVSWYPVGVAALQDPIYLTREAWIDRRQGLRPRLGDRNIVRRNSRGRRIRNNHPVE